jgi:hypothetical protein
MKNLSTCRVVIGVLVVLLAGAACSHTRPVSRHTPPPPPDGNPVHLHFMAYDRQAHSKVLVEPTGNFGAGSCVQTNSCYVYLDYVDVNYSGGQPLAWSTCPPIADACLIVNTKPTATTSDSPSIISSRTYKQTTAEQPSPVNGKFMLVLSSNPL